MRRPLSLVISITLAAPAAAAVVACAHGAGPAARAAYSDPDPSSYATAERELTADQQVAQALGRLTFGARPGEAQRVRAMGVDRWIDLQLHPERIDDSAMDHFVAEHYPATSLPTVELYRQYPQAKLIKAALRMRTDSLHPPTRDDSLKLLTERRKSNEFVGQLVSSKVARAVASERELQEVMADFWENHFTVFVGKGQVRYFLPEYDRDVIRPHALGKFRDLLGAVAKSPAMLFFLDNAQSVADSMHPTLAEASSRGRGARLRARRARPGATPASRPIVAQLQQRRRGLNENYARELMELHTLGVDGGYTQKDVIEVARALTGWTIRPPRQGEDGGEFVFRPEVHDAGEKVVLGHTLKAGRGIEDGEEVLDIVARHPSTARFIARKLAVRFVSDSPSTALVERAAQTFLRTDGDIRETLRTILHSDEFFSERAYRAKVKSPFEVVTSALRAMNAEPDATPRTAQLIARLGQPIFGHQAPNGWPETGDAWMNTGSILNRINFGLAVAAGRIPGASLARWPSADSLRRAPRERQVDGVVATILGGAASSDTRAVLVSGQHPLLENARAYSGDVTADDSTATMASDAMRRREPREAGERKGLRSRPLPPVPQLDGLAQVVGLALGSPEFQRR
jgi:uncharacterized protein (DUF1800 family)